MPRYRHVIRMRRLHAGWRHQSKLFRRQRRRFPDLLRQAFRIATSGSPGPVHLELRGNASRMPIAKANRPV